MLTTEQKRTRIQCSKCRKRFTWHGQGRQWCTACRGANAMREQANAVPDYAAMAERAVVAMGYPREKWQAGGIEHRIVTAILKAWAGMREAA